MSEKGQCAGVGGMGRIKYTVTDLHPDTCPAAESASLTRCAARGRVLEPLAINGKGKKIIWLIHCRNINRR